MSVRASMPLGHDGYPVTVKGHGMSRDTGVAAVAPATRNRRRVRALIPALAGAAVIVTAVAVGAANYGGVSIAPAHVSAQAI
jgi:hypothetical protein